MHRNYRSFKATMAEAERLGKEKIVRYMELVTVQDSKP